MTSDWLAGFDPEQCVTVREPVEAAAGYWVGAPSVWYEAGERAFYLSYRRRNPRGVRPERGHTAFVARSRDGLRFEDIWSVHKDELNTSSMERFCVRRAGNEWFLYLSYVDPADNRWRIDVVTAGRPDGFVVAERRPVLTADATGTEGVKDPYIMRLGPSRLLFASCANVRPMDDDERRAAHATGDIYATGATTAATGLATSLDGRSFAWQGTVFSPGRGWDRYQARLGSVIPAGPAFLGFYDGSASVEENYEERCGLALSLSLTDWMRLTPEEPRFVSRHGTGSLRYVDAVIAEDVLYLYYEYACADGSHELRVNRQPFR